MYPIPDHGGNGGVVLVVPVETRLPNARASGPEEGLVILRLAFGLARRRLEVMFGFLTIESVQRSHGIDYH